MAIYPIVGERIRELRTNKNLSQQALADAAEIERSFLTHIENGKQNVSIETLEKILKNLNISFREFFDHEKFDNL